MSTWYPYSSARVSRSSTNCSVRRSCSKIRVSSAAPASRISRFAFVVRDDRADSVPYVMRPLRYSINVTLDGCCDHREGIVDEDLHRHAAENIEQADALLFGRVTYGMMEDAWRPVAETGTRPAWMPAWMEPHARTIDAAKKYVVSSTLE